MRGGGAQKFLGPRGVKYLNTGLVDPAHVPHLMPRILRWLLHFWQIGAPLIYCVIYSILNYIPYILRTGKCQDKISTGISLVTRLL